MDNTASNINLAFQDLKNLMEMAKDMVRLANVMSSKMKAGCFCFNKFSDRY